MGGRRLRLNLPGLGRRSVAKPCWYSAPHDYWFHYTRPENAEEICDTGLYNVGEHADPTRCGLYLTDIPPGERDADILSILFANQRDEVNVRGVVVLRRQLLTPLADDRINRKRRPGQGYEKKILLADAGDTLDLTLSVVGYGRRDGKNWLFHASVYVDTMKEGT